MMTIQFPKLPLSSHYPQMSLNLLTSLVYSLPMKLRKFSENQKKIVNITLESSKEVIASSWYYENINTDYNGKYYPITEIYIVDGYIESVVFLNSSMEDIDRVEGQKFDIKRPEKIF